MFPYFLEESVYSVVLVVLVAALLLVQSLVYFAPHFFRHRPAASAGLKAFTALAIVTPVVVLLLLITVVYQGRMAMLNAFFGTDPSESVVMFFRGYVMASVQKLYSGYALVVAGFATALYSIVWLCRLRKTGVTAISMVASSGVGTASIVTGLGLSLREFPMAEEIMTIRYADGVERVQLYMKALRDSPSLSVPFVVGAVIVVLTGLIALWLSGREKPLFRVRKTALASGFVALLIGGCAFISTLGQAADVRETLPWLYDTIVKDRPFRVVLVPEGPNRPRLANWKKCEPFRTAPVITIYDGRVDIEGNHVGLYREIIDDRDEILTALGKNLKNLEMNFRQLHSHMDFPGEVMIDADRNAPGAVVEKILVTCYRRGYRQIRLMTLVTSSLSTIVFGELTLTRLGWVPFSLTEGDESGALPFNERETFGEFAKRVDKAAGGGAVKVLLPGVTP